MFAAWMARITGIGLALLDRFRYLKFGIVGASGTVINMAALFLSQEYVFQFVQSRRDRLYLSLAVAIFVATLNNFTWNRLWTWADRMRARTPADGQMQKNARFSLATQFFRYSVASWMGIALNYGLTLWSAQFMHYLLGNLLSIAVASVVNFIANDRWTFRQGKAP